MLSGLDGFERKHSFIASLETLFQDHLTVRPSCGLCFFIYLILYFFLQCLQIQYFNLYTGIISTSKKYYQSRFEVPPYSSGTFRFGPWKIIMHPWYWENLQSRNSPVQLPSSFRTSSKPIFQFGLSKYVLDFRAHSLSFFLVGPFSPSHCRKVKYHGVLTHFFPKCLSQTFHTNSFRGKSFGLWSHRILCLVFYKYCTKCLPPLYYAIWEIDTGINCILLYV